MGHPSNTGKFCGVSSVFFLFRSIKATLANSGLMLEVMTVPMKMASHKSQNKVFYSSPNNLTPTDPLWLAPYLGEAREVELKKNQPTIASLHTNRPSSHGYQNLTPVYVVIRDSHQNVIMSSTWSSLGCTLSG